MPIHEPVNLWCHLSLCGGMPDDLSLTDVAQLTMKSSLGMIMWQLLKQSDEWLTDELMTHDSSFRSSDSALLRGQDQPWAKWCT